MAVKIKKKAGVPKGMLIQPMIVPDTWENRRTHRLSDSYTYYKDSTEHTPVDKKLYMSIIKMFIGAILDAILESHKVKFPCKMGTLLVLGKKENPKLVNGKIHGLAPHWGDTNKLWARDPQAKAEKRVLYCDNTATNGYRYRFLWSRPEAYAKNKALYCLRMTNRNKKRLSNKILAGQEYKTLVAVDYSIRECKG